MSDDSGGEVKMSTPQSAVDSTTTQPPPDPMFDGPITAGPNGAAMERRSGFDFDEHDEAFRAGRHSDVVVGNDGRSRWAGARQRRKDYGHFV